MLARVTFTTAHFDEARAAAREVLRLDGEDFEAFYILARIDLLEGDLAGAEKHLRSALSFGLREDEVARQLAWISLRRNQWDKAAKHLREAGNDPLGKRYAAFDGQPLAAKMANKGCSTSVPALVRDGAVVVEVQVEGETLRLLLDTGASDVIISDERAKRLVIGTDATAPLSAGGPPLAQGQIDLLAIGDYQVANVPVAMFPADQFDMVVGMDQVDGILGIRPFAGRQLSVDVAGGKLEIVEPGKRCAKQLALNRVGETVPFWLHETHYIYVLGQMNGAEGMYLVNTGMRGADLTANEGAYAYAGIGAPPMRANAGAPLVEVERFSLAGWTQPQRVAAWGFMSQNATSDGFRLDGMIGLGVLGEGSWTIDFEQRRIYLRPPAETKAAGKSDAKPENKSDAKPAGKADAKPEGKADAKPEGKADAKPEGRADAKPAGKSDAKPEGKADAKPEGKADAKPEGKPVGKSETKPASKSEATPESTSKKK
jgi:predicted aspartyl protease